MDWRKNEGYIITNQLTVGSNEFVLGVHEAAPNQFVTWQCKDGKDYFWGHYYTDLLSAQKDFCTRALDEIKHLERMKKPKEREPER